MISKWPVLAVGVFVIVLIIGVDSLLGFHIYLTVIRKMTTLEYIFRETSSNTSGSSTAMESESGDRFSAGG
jgi:predicted lipid-binding transport protein (Tim44 family)